MPRSTLCNRRISPTHSARNVSVVNVCVSKRPRCPRLARSIGVITARHATSGACGSGCCCSAPPPRPPLRVPTSRARCARAATPAPRECRCLLLLLHAPCVTPREAAPTTQPAAGCPAAARHAALLALRAATCAAAAASGASLRRTARPRRGASPPPRRLAAAAAPARQARGAERRQRLRGERQRWARQRDVRTARACERRFS